MATLQLGLPSDLRRRLEDGLRHCIAVPCIRVTPRDTAGRTCAAYESDFYEVQAYYSSFSPDLLGPLEEAIGRLPGAYLTTRVFRDQAGPNRVTNPAWPARLGTARPGFQELRPQVLALFRDAPPEEMR